MKKKSIVQVASEAAREAGKFLLARQKTLKKSQIRAKSANDYVTELDKLSEDMIVKRVRRHFPEHAILGEEGGLSGSGGIRWMIDPLDGTTNFIRKLPLFCVSIGVFDAKGPLAGVIYDPNRDELFTAERGKGAFLNGARIRVSKTALADAVLSTAIPFKAKPRFKPYVKCISRLALETAGIRRSGSAAFDLAYVACGRFDGFWALCQGAWDVAAGAVILTEAGGRITDLSGGDRYFETGDVVAGNPAVHAGLRRVVASSFGKN